MKRTRFTEEQIICVLKEAEAGAKTAELARKSCWQSRSLPPTPSRNRRDARQPCAPPDHSSTEATAIVIPEWRFHDIRRTGATNLQALGIPIEVTEAVLNLISGTRAGVAGIYNHHNQPATGGQSNGGSGKQPHATGTGPAGASAALSGPDPFGGTVPIPCGEREPAVQDARREG